LREPIGKSLYEPKDDLAADLSATMRVMAKNRSLIMLGQDPRARCYGVINAQRMCSDDWSRIASISRFSGRRNGAAKGNHAECNSRFLNDLRRPTTISEIAKERLRRAEH